MVKDRGIEWKDAAAKHDYTLDDVLDAASHVVRIRRYRERGEEYVRFIGEHHGDPLVPRLEVIMKLTARNEIVVFHVEAETDGFMDRT
ncbi:hypothetical protein [Bifidobacterium xylocopae]|uniref:Uncharacterized protein n=1 Tax=Bifidobacterium xylocopae TaxID=2493119 RepID=A0A366KBY4_9BIFI|nr:hypothetical protein [Bifidobacterium xylocopae]RBP98752.1 hypothetical protein CRD59_07390 [Bifidobacterium xylocopae]